MDIQPTIPEQLQSPPDNQPTKVQTRKSADGTSEWIDAVGVDHSYRPPPERPIKPAACFFIQPRVVGKPTTDNFYRAIYLMKRSLKEFTNTLAMKCDIEPTEVFKTYRINRDGLHILFDDDCIRELPEGQDMKAEFCEMQPDTPVKPKREWDAGPTDIQCDGELPTVENVSSTGYELKLFY